MSARVLNSIVDIIPKAKSARVPDSKIDVREGPGPGFQNRCPQGSRIPKSMSARALGPKVNGPSAIESIDFGISLDLGISFGKTILDH